MTSRAGWHDRHLELPCSKCIGCRRDRAADWALRCTHEAAQHTHDDGSSNNAFVTLTFSPEGLDYRERTQGTHPLSLDVRDWQLFAKRLRKSVGPFRFLMSAEYGDEKGRPHYHALIFGQDFSGDRKLWKMRDGIPVFLSDTLEKAWPHGHHEIGLVVPETINYVCRYVMKKLNGAPLEEALKRVDTRTGEAVSVSAPFATMSRRPGIGTAWWNEYKRDAFPSDFLVTQGRRTRVPRYYLQKLEEEDPYAALKVRAKRAKKAEEAKRDDRWERLKAKEVIQEQQLTTTHRNKPNNIE